jgi:hypothetical protein
MRPQTQRDQNVGKKENYGMSLCLRAPVRRCILACLALVTVCSLFLLTTMHVQANTVTINDQAGVLDVGRVQAEAAQLPDPMLIYTTKTFTGDQDALDQSTRAQLPDQNAIAIGIDTVHRNLSIEAGTTVQLSNSQASDALSAFQSNYNGGDYTGATIAAIDSLQNALSGGGGLTPLGVAVLILLGLAVVVLIVFAIRRRRRGGSDGSPRIGSWTTPYPFFYYGEIHPTSTPPSGNYDGGAGMSGGGASGSFGGGSTGGGAGGHF